MDQLPRLATGISGLDRILNGGFIEGASYIIQGHPGAGKTIMANQIAFASAMAGHRVLYTTLLAETHDRLFQSLSTLDFFDKTRLGNGIAYISVFQILRDEGLSAVVKLLRKETQRQKATLLIFDGLLNARDRADTDLDVKTFVAEVQSQAAFFGCTVLFLASTRVADTNPEHTMVDGVIELHEETSGVRAVRRLQVRKSRGSASLGGCHQFEITENGVAVYPRLELAFARPSVEDHPTFGRVASGVDGLDALMDGGLPRGSVTLLCGPSGAGKTSLCLSFLEQASAAEPGLYFGFYETPARLQAKGRAISLDLQSQIESGALEFLWHPLTENLLDKLAHRLLDAVSQRGVKRLVIDGIAGFDRAAVNKPRLVEFYAILANELRARGVTTFMTSETRDTFGTGVMTPNSEIISLLDNLIALRLVELQSWHKRVISVVKVRDSRSDSRLHEVDFGERGLKIVSPFSAISEQPAPPNSLER